MFRRSKHDSPTTQSTRLPSKERYRGNNPTTGAAPLPIGMGGTQTSEGTTRPGGAVDPCVGREPSPASQSHSAQEAQPLPLKREMRKKWRVWTYRNCVPCVQHEREAVSRRSVGTSVSGALLRVRFRRVQVSLAARKKKRQGRG